MATQITTHVVLYPQIASQYLIYAYGHSNWTAHWHFVNWLFWTLLVGNSHTYFYLQNLVDSLLDERAVVAGFSVSQGSSSQDAETNILNIIESQYVVS